MTLLPDLKYAESRFYSEIEMVQTICAAQGIPYGRPDDLFAFAFHLSHEPGLLQSVSDFVVRLHRHAALEYPFSDTLSIFLLGIGGPTAGSEKVDLSSSAGLLTSFLLSLDLWSEVDLREAAALEDSIRIELSREDRQSVEAGPHLVEVPAFAAAAFEDQPLPSQQELSAVIERLERSNHELREQLLAMDHRVRLIEPHPIPDPPSAVPAPTPRASVLTAPLPEPAPADPRLVTPGIAPPRAADPPRKPSRHLTEQEHLADQRRIEAPLRRRRLLRTAAIVAVSVSAAGALLYTSLHSSTADKTARVDQAPTSAPLHPPDAGSSMVAPSDTASSEQTPPHLTIYSASPTASSVRTRPAIKPSAAFTSHAGTPRDVAEARSLDSEGLHPINVSSSVMAERLVSSVPPAYPRLAALTHLHGVVVLRATIAKDGKVERVHALGGHYLLRSAATNAVKSWRYRPYYLNGEPVEVATLVTIDFAQTP